MLKTFYSIDAKFWSENSCNWKSEYGKPLLSNSSIVPLVAQYELYSMNISRVDLFHITSYLWSRVISHSQGVSVLLQLIHNNLLHLSVALNISYSLLSAEELQDGITKQPSTYVWRVF